MDPVLLFYLSSADESENCEKIVRRQLRDTSCPLSLPHKAWFRLNKEAFQYVYSKLTFSARLPTAVPPVLQLAATLSLLASGGYQHSIGSDYLIGMCQSSVSKLTSNVLQEIEDKLCPLHILFIPANSSGCKAYFFEKFKIPGVIGCIDGTHVGLQRPIRNEHMFANRKGFHSLNAMIICDHKYVINVVNELYGGAAHDWFIWKHSDQQKVLEDRFLLNRNENGWLLGDSGYPLEPWCITPYRNPLHGSDEAKFNAVHSKARSTIERAIGILKGRWRILGYYKRGRYLWFEKNC